MKLPKRHSKGGRPRQDQAGDVDVRLLDAGLDLFLARGFDGATCEEIARLAGAGKASLYARYANKDAIFEAVVRRNVQTLLVPEDVNLPSSLDARLRRVGLEILEHALRDTTVAMMRLVIATATRAPALAAEVNRIGWEGGVARVRRAILAGNDAPSNPDPLAHTFVDLVFAPHQLRALLGEDIDGLRRSAPERVDQALKVIRAAGLLG
ncbi:TetR/AcrR family transcriptional regulator [Luteimonas sp. 3794]|uniref:TetR/AcrR family transcriptional regulator n=1 Tax=Luteimonas sp. 3794 TaxID=2817730 RepID=UPI00286786AE|nr:TetR/AcrR family transcriptional regulator [Luteimonas sp. 3794]MDR6990278.1 AcrR family transcriptional regulator [Luteimonas sp. 3794]